MSKPTKSTNVVWHQSTITRADRETLHKHKGAIIWFTGLSGSGKSTLSHAVEDILHKSGCSTIVLDGDNIRHGLNGDLGFSDAARVENIRRIGEVSKLFVEAGVIVLTAFISPFRSDRDRVRGIVQPGDFIEVFCDAPLDVCEQRDPKGLYKKARAGEIKEFTGISSPYEAPEMPELVINTGAADLDACARQVVAHLKQNNIVRS